MSMTPNKKSKWITGGILAVIIAAIVISICIAVFSNTNTPKISILSCPEKVYYIDPDYQSKNSFIIKSAYVYDDGDIKDTSGTISYNFVNANDSNLLSIDSTGEIEVKYDAFSSTDSSYQVDKDDVIKVEIIVSSTLKGVNDIRHTINVVRKNDYSITLDLNGGSLAEINPEIPVPAWEGQAVNLSNPTLTKYTFDGWYVVAVGDNTYDYDEVRFFSEDIYYWGENISLRARYKTNIKLCLDGIAADVESERLEDVYFNESLSSEHIRVLNQDIGTVEVQGWTLSGWFTGTGGTGVENGVQNGVFCSVEPNLHAKWCGTAKLNLTGIIKNDDNKDIITREGNVGTLSANAVTDIPVVYNGTVQLNSLQIPTYPYGGVFDGWYTGLYGFGTKITDKNGAGVFCSTDLNLYDKISFTVGIDYNSATGNFDSNNNFFTTTYGDVVDLVGNGLGRNPTKTGWDFNYWEVKYGLNKFAIPHNMQFTLLEDITITAMWKWDFALNTHIADYELEQNIATIYFGEESYLDSLNNWGSWEFAGWYTQPSGEGQRLEKASDYNATSARTLYAKWQLPKLTLKSITPKIIEYNVIENANIVYGKPIENSLGYILPIPETPDGYNNGLGWFNGIDDNSERITNTLINYPKVMDVLYYKWTPSTYTITLNHDGGSNGYNSTITATMGQNLPDLTQYIPTKYSYTFLGYYYSTEDNLYYSAAMTGCKEWENFESDTFQLTALWGNPCEVTLDPVIPYDSNYADSEGSSIIKVRLGDAMPSGYIAPKRAGYTFLGFYEYKNGKGRQYYDENMKGVKDIVWEKDVSSATIYAYWKEKKLSATLDNSTPSMHDKGATASITMTVNNGSDKYNYAIISTSHPNLEKPSVNNGKVSLKTSGNENNGGTVTVQATDVRTGETVSKDIKYKTTKQECVAAGTLITLADGTRVPVESLTGDELLLVWNIYLGVFDVAPILFVDSDAETSCEIINLFFSDGTSVKVISEHGFWDYDLNEWVFLRNDAEQYIGHWFNKQDVDYNGNWINNSVQLVNVVITEEVTTAWSPVTFGHLCYYVNGMLSMPGATEGFINIFDVNPESLQVDENKMAADIENYGLFTYDDFAEYIPEEVFKAFNGQYLKVAIGKGLLTWDDIFVLINKYQHFWLEEV